MVLRPKKPVHVAQSRCFEYVYVYLGRATRTVNVKDRVIRTASHTHNNYRGSFFEELHKLLAGDGVMNVGAAVFDGAFQNL